MKWRQLITLVSVSAIGGCAATLPPEKLVAVDAELSKPNAMELAEAQPGPLRLAQQHRDDAWKALDDGERERAETHAWVAWLQVRVAENLEAGSQERAAQKAPSTMPGGAPGPGVQIGTTSSMTATSGAQADGKFQPARQPVPIAPVTAMTAVAGAEDAKLRLLSAGLTPDVRWAEADTLLEIAQRALDRGNEARAMEMARRAELVFEVIRVSRLGGGNYAPAGSPGGSGATSGSQTGQAGPRATKAMSAAWAELVKRRPAAEQTGCTAELAEAEGFLKRAETRRDAGDLAGSDAYVGAATAHLARCADLEDKAVATRVTPLRKDAEARLKKATDKAERARISRLIADSDAAVARGDIVAAQTALLRSAQGEDFVDPVGAGKPSVAGTPVQPAVGTPAAVAATPGVTVGVVPGVQPGVQPTVVGTNPQVIVIPGGGTNTTTTTGNGTNSATTTPAKVEPPKPKSRVVTNILQPIVEDAP